MLETVAQLHCEVSSCESVAENLICVIDQLEARLEAKVANQRDFQALTKNLVPS